MWFKVGIGILFMLSLAWAGMRTDTLHVTGGSKAARQTVTGVSNLDSVFITKAVRTPDGYFTDDVVITDDLSVDSASARTVKAAGSVIVNDGTTRIEMAAGSGIASIGTATKHPVNMLVNGVPIVCIDTTGNVGIGNLAPSSKMHVTGNIAVSGTVDGVDVSSFKSDYDGKINQDLRTSASPSFGSINTGQGYNSVYYHDQELATTSNVQHDSLTLNELYVASVTFTCTLSVGANTAIGVAKCVATGDFVTVSVPGIIVTVSSPATYIDLKGIPAKYKPYIEQSITVPVVINGSATVEIGYVYADGAGDVFLGRINNNTFSGEGGILGTVFTYRFR